MFESSPCDPDVGGARARDDGEAAPEIVDTAAALPFLHPPWPAAPCLPPSPAPAACEFRFRAEPEELGGLLTDLIGNPVDVLAAGASQTLDILCPYPFASFRPTGGGRKRVTLVFREFDGIAHTTRPVSDGAGVCHQAGGSSAVPCPRCAWCEVHLSAKYVRHRIKQKGAEREIRGVLVHELVHVFLVDPSGPPGKGTWALSEGIADFVRLRVGLGAEHWRKRAGGAWTDGYHVTAYFLDWIDRARPGFVTWIGYVMGWQRWFDSVWTDGAGAPVDQLWKMYQDELRSMEVTSTGEQSPAQPPAVMPTEAPLPP